MSNYQDLFKPIQIGNMTLRNRGVMPSMVTNYCAENGEVSDRFIAYHEARAKGGVGLIIVEAAYVTSNGKGFTNQIGIDSDALIPGLKKLTDAVHKHGAKIAIQIYHGGRQANTFVTGEAVVAPSAIPCPVMQSMPKALSIEEIKEMVNSFADAAERAKKSGFDTVEIHGAHGYLLNQFLSPNSNHREDIYGGSAENRGRFPLEVVDAVRTRVGDDFPLIYRITSEEFLPDGLTIEDTTEFSKILVKHKIDAINVSGSTYVAGKTSSGAEDGLGFYIENASKIKNEIDSVIPIIVANRIKSPDLANDAIASGKTDMIATGRELLCDPDFYNKIQNELEDEIRTCLSCNHCVNELMSGVPISCLYNPMTGHENDYDLSIPASTKKNVLVIGGGPSGMESALIARLKGHDVTLYESTNALGGNVIPGSKPPFKSEMFACIDYLTHMLNKKNVKIVLNSVATIETVKDIKPDFVILATGSNPIVPNFPGVNGMHVISAEKVLMGECELGEKVVVIGGGSVGVETAEYLEEQHKSVTIIEMADAILADLSMLLKGSLLARVSSSNMSVLTGQRVLEIKENAVVTDQQTVDSVDNVVLAVGYRANNPLIGDLEKEGFAYKVTGDAVKPRKIYQAVKEGFEAAYSI